MALLVAGVGCASGTNRIRSLASELGAAAHEGIKAAFRRLAKQWHPVGTQKR
jgi:hypothetical protein